MRLSCLRLCCAAVAALAAQSASGCSAIGSSDDGRPDVVAAFYPFAYVAQRVAGEHADVTNLTSPGLEPHDLELTPQQIAELSDADVVIFEAGFQASVDDAVEQNPPAEVLEVIELLERKDAHTEHGKDHDASAKSVLADDPHLWQNPTLLIPIAEQLAEHMAAADPDHAADYRAGADDLIDDLNHLDDEFKQGLASCERRQIVTSHAAFGYLAERYDLIMTPIAGLTPDIEPSPENLAKIQDLIESEGITTVFSETLGSKDYAETLATDLGVTAAVLDPIEGLEDQDSDENYLSLMRQNLVALHEANDCS
ncbi:MAG: metal ABC transporter substrate-binding protein [Nocardioidaceae bacterium]